jgi:drug/metabolite transporter (DMT)-like permease
MAGIPPIEDRPGIARALASAALFGLSAPAAKWLLAEIDPWLLAGLLYLGCGVGLGAFWLARRALGRAPEAPLRRADLPWLVAAIACGGGIAPVLLMLALARGPASQTALLLSLEGVLTVLLAWCMFREQLDGRLALGMGVITAGAVVLAWPSGGGVRPGPAAVLVLGACLAWAADNNLTRRLSGGDSVLVAAVKGAAAGAVNLVIAMALGASLPRPGAMLAAACVGLLAYGVSLVLFVRSLADLGAARTSAYFATAPFIGAVAAVVLLGEPRTPRLGISAACMALGLWLYVGERHGHEHAHQPLEHEHRHRHDAHHPHAGAAPALHSHPHVHVPTTHAHPHYPDLHHRDGHR